MNVDLFLFSTALVNVEIIGFNVCGLCNDMEKYLGSTVFYETSLEKKYDKLCAKNGKEKKKEEISHRFD
jgi:hypothetical protein